MKKVLTIAGSDSGGGAGIQADLKTFAARGVYGTSAITAITAQNTMGVQGIFELPADFVALQIASVMEDIGADVWKIGMIANVDIIRVVADCARRYKIERLVLDPVMVAKGGDPLLRKDARDALIQELIPLAYVITPNLPEAQVLSNLPTSGIMDMQSAARAIHKMGAKYVVIKGGHLTDTDMAVDILYNGTTFTEFSEPFINSLNTHGTGCTFASAIAAELAKGSNVEQAVKIAKTYVTAAIQEAVNLNIGKGHGPLNHFLERPV